MHLYMYHLTFKYFSRTFQAHNTEKKKEFDNTLGPLQQQAQDVLAHVHKTLLIFALTLLTVFDFIIFFSFLSGYFNINPFVNLMFVFY